MQHVRKPSIGSWAGQRPTLGAALVCAVLAVSFVAQGLLPGRSLSGSDYLWSAAPWTSARPPDVRPFGANPALFDEALALQPFLLYSRASLPSIPLWNPHIMGGRPFLGNAQSAVLSPFSAPAYVLPFWRSLALIAALKLFAAAFGTYLLGRAIGMRFGGALAAAVVFGFGLFMVEWLKWPLSSVWVLMPWLLLATERLVRKPDPLTDAALAAVVALQFLCGQPESSFHVLFATLCFFVLRASRRWGRSLLGPALWFAGGLLAGTLLAALVILPFLELLKESGDVSLRDFVGPRKRPAGDLIGLFLPHYWGRPTDPSPGAAAGVFTHNYPVYAGALTLMLGLAALMLRPSLERVAVTAFGVVVLAVAHGIQPLFGLVNALPGFSAVKNDRLIILFLMSVALLAGWGLDDLSERVPIRKGRALLVVCAGILLFPALWMIASGRLSLDHFRAALELAFGLGTPSAVLGDEAASSGVVRLASLIAWGALAGAGVALLAVRLRERLTAGPFVALAIGLVVVDLFLAGVGFNPAIPVEHAAQPTTAAVRYLQSRNPNRFVGLGRESLFGTPPLPADVAMKYGLYDARGYDFPIEKRYFTFWGRAIAPTLYGTPLPSPSKPTPATLQALGLLSVSDLVQDPADPPLQQPGLRLAYDGADARVYANERALPRAFLVHRALAVEDGEQALAAVTREAFDARRVAVTEERISELTGAGGARGSASLATYEDDRAVVDTESAGPALVVLTDAYFPGWRATVDGESAQVHRVDYLLRGVVVPGGRHRVKFAYEPASWRAGLIVSGVALIVVLASAGYGWRARRRRGSG